MPPLPADLSWKIFTMPWTDGYLPVLCVMVLLNTALGIVASLAEKTFDWEYTANWLRTQALPYLFGWYTLAVMAGLADTGLMGDAARATALTTATGAYLAILAALTADIVGKLGRLGVLGGGVKRSARRKAKAKLAARGMRPPETGP